ncbi:MAG TPA: cell division protein ZipA C-terminal FtsZ-binding domain-containing protein [Burkholderiales bacterium]|nr:cell division protein ZipA C-terminal FtsZ-binding domain-containing protein [Burkholderiales bacterium]
MVYNRFQERSARRQAQRTFASSHADVLLDGRREPAAEPRRSAPQPGVALAEKIDYVIDVELPSPQARAVIWESWLAVERRFSRRVQLAGTDQPTARSLRAALQLISREGVVSDAELLEFRSMVETMAAQLGASARAPEMRAALDGARELDRTCAEADIQVALHVVGIGAGPAEFPDQPFQATPREDGVTLTLDVARTAEPSRTYEAMVRAGRQLAQARGGRLVDDQGHDLDERALAAIGRELESVRQSLAACGIEAGSPLALRVFS